MMMTLSIFGQACLIATGFSGCMTLLYGANAHPIEAAVGLTVTAFALAMAFADGRLGRGRR